ncbi:hypothetical protein CDAR_568691 [Caerostris darwini]|uniref:Uncharacterized protein n=1 Tax=Caerostris darwini TaxID=1538125 RepID=A0AAV4SVE6_9ARAC|nr:hypothetical protein CDAR_568691 [Caerostris darwini]
MTAGPSHHDQGFIIQTRIQAVIIETVEVPISQPSSSRRDEITPRGVAFQTSLFESSTQKMYCTNVIWRAAYIHQLNHVRNLNLAETIIVYIKGKISPFLISSNRPGGILMEDTENFRLEPNAIFCGDNTALQSRETNKSYEVPATFILCTF